MRLRPAGMSAVQVPDDVVAAVRVARHIAVLTGAGVSAESGIPTFREALTGLWERFRPEELATPQAFARDPKLVWEWYAWRRELVGAAQPNPAHTALARLAQLVPRLTLVTQNVDGLHQRAGNAGVIELHGNIMRSRCFHENTPVEVARAAPEVPPRCPRCGGPVRPDVVWFGEALPPGVLDAATAAAGACDVFLSVGTSNLVEPAASLPWLAAQRGTPVVVINVTSAGQRAGGSIRFLEGPAGALLPALLAAAWPEETGGVPD